MTKHIAVFLPDPALGMSAMLIKDLCWIAARYYDQLTTGENGKSLVTCFSLSDKTVQAASGGPIHADCDIDKLGDPDAVFLSAFWGDSEACLNNNQALIPKLQHWHESDIPIIGVSNAQYFMAEAGLLENKVATVYPPAADDFAKRYPNVNLRSSRALTDAGNLYCANGIASGCDLIISIIEILFGPEIARRMNQEFLLGFQRNYSLANLEFDGQKYHTDHQIMTAQHWLERNFKDEISIESLAADRGMSPRNFSRRFKLATGDTPSHYLQRARMEMAKELLANTEMQIAEIAYEVGYLDSSYFSRIFKKSTGCLPLDFRNQLRMPS